MIYDLSIPYDDLLLLPPADDINTKPVLAQCIKSSHALGKLKGTSAKIPDQTSLINSIPLREAKLSSEIENIVTTQDDLFYANLGGTPISDTQTKEVS